jgi:hypothetical protein
MLKRGDLLYRGPFFISKKFLEKTFLAIFAMVLFLIIL